MNNARADDTSTRRWLTVMVSLQVLTRLPYLFRGYGGDDDAWRIARAAHEFLRGGVYTPSRPPGYPLFEGVNALLVPLGKWYLSNGATLLVSLGAFLVFHRIIRTLKLEHWKLLLVLFAFFPLFWTNAANTMDYVWALLCVLGGFLQLLKGRHVLAGVLVGLAVGFRLSSCLFVLPFAAYLLAERDTRRALIFTGVATFCGLIAFAPPLLQSGTAAFSYFKPQSFEATHIPYYMVSALGLAPALIVALGLARHRHGLWRDLRDGDGVVLACVVSVLTVAALFCLVPHDRAYLLPLFPFLFILLGRYLDRKWLAAFVVFALVFGFVKIEVKDDRSADVVRIRPHLATGPVVNSFRHLDEQMELRDALAPYLAHEFAPDEKGVLVSGFVLGLAQLVDNPAFSRVELPGIGTDVYALADSETLVMSETMDAAAYAYFTANGYRMVFVEGALRYARNAYGFEVDAASSEVVQASDILAIADGTQD